MKLILCSRSYVHVIMVAYIFIFCSALNRNAFNVLLTYICVSDIIKGETSFSLFLYYTYLLVNFETNLQITVNLHSCRSLRVTGLQRLICMFGFVFRLVVRHITCYKLTLTTYILGKGLHFL